ncbi:LLM class F420-dependent oxidoreductase [Parafrankia sp. BMG5.11]|uniref:LLM class F420-dependent oxidoreductase n=1 Tax=Parafrankia sp. BMG5.11 TaxID=222540 RepID=UPI00103944F8|nr:LLM class F420-dependent oxidoreductase [Parafrankia sp. BMG5.11]TCJ35737.1 LLM class F420-dependent oxidoreductase [Parafrankia sp. BMG5.11]
MRLGVVYPQIELEGDPSSLARFARAAEELGYDHLVLYDHVIGASHERRDPPIRGRYGERSPFHDPLTAFAYLAGLTERIEFVSGVLILPLRQTVLVARQTADIDLMSGGRLRLGVGAGYNRVEFHAMGVDFASRGRRLTEQISYLRRLWSEELISFEGEFDQIDRANIVPRPTRRIPIWCGGFAEAAFRRAVALADGFVFGYGLDQPAMDGWARLRELLAIAGRPLDGFGAQFVLHAPGQPYTDQEITDGLLRLRAAGATHASLFTMGRGLTGVDRHIDYIAEIMKKAEVALR